MASGGLSADRLGDEIRLARITLVEGDGDLVGAEEGVPEVMPLVRNGSQDFADARFNGLVLPNGHIELRQGKADQCRAGGGAGPRPGSPVVGLGRRRA